ncbi:MAG: BON domain-containing protein, partial [Planctomycetia bacterium]|nr:BON domain-containing protein [Planctomycetia bacterium]
MSILRSAFVMAVVGTSFVLPAARADDLAGSVAAKLRESGSLAGYRVNVKAKSGTVWLEGRVADQKQLAAAMSLAENTPGVERVVNRLAIGKQAESAGGTPTLSMPSSAWGVVGMPSPAAAKKGPTPAAAAKALAEGSSNAGEARSAPRGLLAFGGQEASVQLAQALAPTARPQGGASGRQAPNSPRPLAMTSARSMQPAPGQAQPQPMQGMGRDPRMDPRNDPRNDPRTAMRGPVQRTSMRGGMAADPMHLPSPNGYEGPVADGQMVPGSMRTVEGGPVNGGVADGGYASGGQAGAGGYASGGPGYSGGPMPMGGTGVGMPPIPGRSDGPNMPNYAWPSYAASPNVAAVQYPTQYSPTAWPYIGPFYPYPQVPLGWRRVSLEWDDGWWWLDFDER